MADFRQYTKLSPRTEQLALACLAVLLCCMQTQPLQAQNDDTPSLSPSSAPDAADDATPAEKLRFANGLLARGFHDMAKAEFRAFLRAFPKHSEAPAAMFGIIQCCRAQEDMDATVSRIREFRKRWPDHELVPKLHLWEGETLIRQGNLAQAEDTLKKLLGEEDSVIREAALYFIGEATMRRGAEEKALAVYRKLADHSFDDTHQYRPYAVYALGAHAQHRGDVDTAQRMFRRLADGEPVPSSLQEESLYRLAQSLFRQENFAEAIVHYESLLVEFPEGRFAREARKRRLWAHYQLENFEKAADLASQWRERYNTFDHEVLFIHAASLMTREQHSEARKLFAKLGQSEQVPKEYRRSARYQHIFCALKLDDFSEVRTLAKAFLDDFPDAPERIDVQFFQARAAAETDNHKQAAQVFVALLDETPDNWEYRPEAVNLLADAYAELGQADKQTQLLRAESQKGGKWAARWLLEAAETERENGNREAAIRDLEALLENYSDSRQEAIAATLYLAELYSIEQRFDQAEAQVKKLLDEQETNAIRGRLHYLLGYVYGRQQELERAEEQLRAALEKTTAPELVGEAKSFLVHVLLKQEKTDQALELFAEILEVPIEKRQQMDADLLFRLERIYFQRNLYDTCRALCNWLRTYPDPDVRFRAGTRLAELHIATKELDKAKKILGNLRDEQQEALADGDEQAGERLGAVSSLLGEAAMLSGEKDRAVTAFEEALGTQGLKPEFSTRARWGLAAILHRENRPEQALRYAMNAFILGDDPAYTPKAMFKAVEILVELDRIEEARTTWNELRTRYSAYAARQEQTDAVRAIAGDEPEKN
ncbi:MAG: tetratricopeptide repeat protein [Verrucomicrobiota bacterium]